LFKVIINNDVVNLGGYFMFLHLGGDTVVSVKDVICIMDYSSSMNAKDTREFLKQLEQKNKIIKISNEDVKSFVITQSDIQSKSKDIKKSVITRIYYSPISSTTLFKRIGYIDDISL
jgi:extracellular matrix regulatory protein B